MIVFYVLIGIVVIAGGVVGFLFFLLNKEANKPAEQKVEPVTVMPEKLVVDNTPSEEALEYKRRVEDLENELKDISDRGTAQASEAMTLIEKLTKENEDLKMEKLHSGGSSDELIEAQKQADQLRQDNFVLSNQLEQASGKVQELQQEAMVIRQKMEDDIKQSYEIIENLKAEKEAIILNRESSGQSTQTLNRELEEIRAQSLEFQNEITNLRDANDKLKASNESMFNQTQMFQQELMRQRAQISGLERICENYRIQVEEKANS